MHAVGPDHPPCLVPLYYATSYPLVLPFMPRLPEDGRDPVWLNPAQLSRARSHQSALARRAAILLQQYVVYACMLDAHTFPYTLCTATGPCDNNSELTLPCLYYDQYQAEVSKRIASCTHSPRSAACGACHLMLLATACYSFRLARTIPPWLPPVSPSLHRSVLR